MTFGEFPLYHTLLHWKWADVWLSGNTTHTSSRTPLSPLLFRSEHFYFLYSKYLWMENAEITVKQIMYRLLALTVLRKTVQSMQWNNGYTLCGNDGRCMGRETLTSLAHTLELTWVLSLPLKSSFLFCLFPLGWPVICIRLTVWPFYNSTDVSVTCQDFRQWSNESGSQGPVVYIPCFVAISAHGVFDRSSLCVFIVLPVRCGGWAVWIQRLDSALTLCFQLPLSEQAVGVLFINLQIYKLVNCF